MTLETLSVELSEQASSVGIMKARIKSLETLINQINDKKKSLMQDEKDIRMAINQCDSEIEDVRDELMTIKNHWDIIIASRDPILKSRIINHRYYKPCKVCGEKLFSKKDLKVHLFTKHSY